MFYCAGRTRKAWAATNNGLSEYFIFSHQIVECLSRYLLNKSTTSATLAIDLVKIMLILPCLWMYLWIMVPMVSTTAVTAVKEWRKHNKFICQVKLSYKKVLRKCREISLTGNTKEYPDIMRQLCAEINWEPPRGWLTLKINPLKPI